MAKIINNNPIFNNKLLDTIKQHNEIEKLIAENLKIARKVKGLRR